MLSTRVLQEYYVNAREVGLDEEVARRQVEAYSRLDVAPIDTSLILEALDTSRLRRLSSRDALIARAARAARCARLLSEDLYPGQTIDRVKVENPFTCSVGTGRRHRAACGTLADASARKETERSAVSPGTPADDRRHRHRETAMSIHTSARHALFAFAALLLAACGEGPEATPETRDVPAGPAAQALGIAAYRIAEPAAGQVLLLDAAGGALGEVSSGSVGDTFHISVTWRQAPVVDVTRGETYVELLADGLPLDPEDPVAGEPLQVLRVVLDEPTPLLAHEDAGHVATVAQALAIRSGGTSASYCSCPPLHCGGDRRYRAVYPGCIANCNEDQVAMCICGSCFWRSAANCVCLDRGGLPPQ